MGLQPTDKLAVCQPHVQLGDPHVLSDDRSRLSLLAALYETLVRRDRGGRYRPLLAESWSVGDDARTWTFNLRSRVTFHNGDTLGAGDVVATLERVRDPQMGGELGTGGVLASYLAGSMLEAADQTKVRIVTAEPMADLLDLLVGIPIVPSNALHGLPDTPVGSGPYRLQDAEDGRIVMKASYDHWAGDPTATQVIWLAVPDAEERVTRLRTGQADLITDVPPEARQRVQETPETDLRTAYSSVCATFMCNIQSGVCVDRRVRQALNYALDMQEIIRAVVDGSAQPLNGPLTTLHLGYDPDTPPYPYDPDLARTLLAEAGYGNGMTLTLDIPIVLPDEAPELARLMAEQYSRVGIETKIEEHEDRPGYADMVRAKQINDAACFDSSPLSTYRVLREKFHSGVRGPWWQGYSNSEVDNLLNQAWATPDDKQRQAIYRRAYRLLRDDAPWIFLYNPLLGWGIGPRARGWTPSVDGIVRLA